MTQRRRFTKQEMDYLIDNYKKMVGSGRLSEMATIMGSSKSVLCEKAKTMGLTDAQEARAAAAKISGDKLRGKPMKHPHPKGFLGKTHSALAREKMAAASRKFWASVDDEERAKRSNRMAEIGKKHSIFNRGGASWKAGWREIGGKRNYYRSRWEANYARYLEWLKLRGDIADWQHEPETFWFEAIKRGVRSYLPDFRVWENDGSTNLHEVKGWMDARSKTTLKRMAKYHPQENVIVIRERGYNDIAKKVGPLIEGWEVSERSGRQ